MSRMTVVGYSVEKKVAIWRLTCSECAKPWQPEATVYAQAREICPHCRKAYNVDYNRRTMRPDEFGSR